MAHLHDADFVLDCCALVALWLREFQGEKLAITDSHAAENSSETTSSFFADNFVELRGVLHLNVSSLTDLSRDLATVLEDLLRIVELTQDDLEEGARVVCDFICAKHAKLVLETLGEADPLEAARIILAHRNLDFGSLVVLVSHYEIALILDNDLVVSVLCNSSVNDAAHGVTWLVYRSCRYHLGNRS